MTLTAPQKALITRVIRGGASNAIAARALGTHRRGRLASATRNEIIAYAVERGAHKATLNTEMP